MSQLRNRAGQFFFSINKERKSVCLISFVVVSLMSKKKVLEKANLESIAKYIKEKDGKVLSTKRELNF